MKKSILSYPSLNTDLAALLLRFIVGGLMIYHGYSKLTGYNQILPMFGDIIGIGSKASLILVIFAEFFCGLFVVLGFLTRLSIIPIFITMIVAYFIAHGKDPFQMKELAFIFLTLCLPVFLLGSGKYSIDSLIFKNRTID
jgi:putative oxidoreductase